MTDRPERNKDNAVADNGPMGSTFVSGMQGRSVAFEEGQRIRLPDERTFVVVEFAQQADDGTWKLGIDDGQGIRKLQLAPVDVQRVEFLHSDGGAQPAAVLAGLWSEWMRRAGVTAKATALASTPLVPYPHQNRAVYGAMLPQPLLRFLLSDEPGTGKTIMGGLWLREMQRLGFVSRAIVVAPAHLVTKWQGDFDRFLGGGLRRITADTVREGALSTSHDLWVVSLELAAVNPQVYEAIHPDRAGWDAVVFDEAHRLTPTAVAYHRVGQMLAHHSSRAVLMTATPHRGSELLFRSLMHLVDPTVFPAVERFDDAEPRRALRPGPLHFLRRMKEELVDYDGATPLFKGRRATNLKVPLSVDETTFYNEALDLVDKYFPPSAIGLAKMVYGKRTASSLWALRETLRRRGERMGTANPSDAAIEADPFEEDEAERDLARVVHEISRASREERKDVNALVERLDAIFKSEDFKVSKWPRMVNECLSPNRIEPNAEAQVVVFTEFADTADWLVKRFRAEGWSCRRYSGRDTTKARDDIRARFAGREFQVLVSTDAGNEGIDLQSAHVLVNWDIPWSLVRLEQRMGRIHRVGQYRDVELYNLIATDTREGDAHAQLLDRLVAAANELGGKMFDSLSLIGDLALEEAGIDLERLLHSTYEGDHDARAVALAAVKAITKERLRQIHERERASEDFLASGVDVAAAVTSLHDERLERINPHIVERFLQRTQGAGLIRFERSALADEGLWLLAAKAIVDVPKEFSRSVPILVATSGDAKRRAVEAGQVAAQPALGLGPSDPSFRALVHAISDQLRPSLFRGGHLVDPTSITDYELFCYETPVSEGGGRRDVTWSYLVRVDETGARVVSWELLANLEPGAPEPRTPHPANVTDGTVAADAAARKDMAQREASLAEWLAGAKRQLEQLPNDLTDEIIDKGKRIAARSRIKVAVGHRVEELQRATEIEIGDIRQVGWAHISATGVPPDPTEKDSEMVAMTHVTKLLRDQGWAVADVHTERPGTGFDLHARKGRNQRCVEVKGVWSTASSAGVTLTGNELAKAGLLAADYWLYVIDQCQKGSGSLYAAYQNPALVFADAARDVAVLHINGSALKQAKEAQLT